MNFWKRWDPRLGPMPLCEAKLAKKWVIEVVPDLFAPGREAVAEATFKAIGALRYQSQSSPGRFLLRTAYPTEAARVLRRISDKESRGYGRYNLSEVPCRLVLALYAETLAQVEERTALLFALRPKCEEIALTDPAAGIALAVKDGLLSMDLSFEKKDVEAALAQGPRAVHDFLQKKVAYGHRTDGIPVDSGGMALYLSPREPIDLRPFLETARQGSYRQTRFNWIVCAGRTGPLAPEPRSREYRSPRANDPHPMHPGWIRKLANAARDAKLPFCVPTLGEWGDDSTNAKVPTKYVDYDPSWNWEERGWDRQHPDAKPNSAQMHAVGSMLSGRAVYGHIYDEFPGWYPR